MKPNLTLSCSVTESHLKEFLLLKYSAELFHECEWFLSCDQFCFDYLNQFVGCHCENLNLQNGKVFGDEKEISNFYGVIEGKFRATERAIKKRGGCLLVDSDIIFCGEFRINCGIHNADASLSPHYQWNKEMDKAWGFYNVGFVYIWSLDFLKSWEEETKSGKHQFEQVPIEIVARTEKFNLLIFPIGENMGWWRFNNEKSCHRFNSFDLIGDSIVFDGNPVSSFHFHSFVACPHSKQFKSAVFGQIFPKTTSGRKILEEYNRLTLEEYNK